MRRPEFAGRPGNFSGTFFQKGKTGITTTEGKHWSKQRGFLVNHLEGLTNSKGFEEVILDEFSDLKVDLSRKKTPVAVSYKLNVAIMNILWNLCSGRKLHSQQQEFQTVYECIDKVWNLFKGVYLIKILRSHSSCPALRFSALCQSSQRFCLSQ